MRAQRSPGSCRGVAQSIAPAPAPNGEALKVEPDQSLRDPRGPLLRPLDSQEHQRIDVTPAKGALGTLGTAKEALGT
ncbi:hypothetical protein NDU88_003209 [Pleurodeles waltl]|uniref:Uncharacterized protein n=1 Tax=Pleurodeles waltl TaxID=8319 RepID=A0AAV7M4K3_PLEWA|nr:hypothetical protein NDU88_003209 [Pleurodeles waltl]